MSTSAVSRAAAGDHNPKRCCRIQDFDTLLAEGADHVPCSAYFPGLTAPPCFITQEAMVWITSCGMCASIPYSAPVG